jgi:hypothetical protein
VRFSRSLLAVFAVGTLSLSLTACGGDDGGLDGNASAEDIAEAIEENTGGQVSADDIEDEVADAIEGVNGACAGAAFLAGGLFTAFTGAEGLDQVRAYFDTALDDAPDEIKGDLTVLRETYEELGTLVEEHGGLAAAMSDPEVQAEFEELDTPEVEQASDNVEAWISENCDPAN